MNLASSSRHLRITTPLVALASVFVVAGGFVHLREWLDVYRHLPADTPGAAVVRIGFPVNAAASVLLVLALAAAAWKRHRLLPHVVLANVLLQAGSLAVLVATRRGSVLGWSEPAWTTAAEQARAVGIAALIALLALGALARHQGEERRETNRRRTSQELAT